MAEHVKLHQREIITEFAKDNPKVPELEFIRADPDGVLIDLLDSGTVNYIFIVKSRNRDKTVIIKHSTPHRKNDPSTSMPMKRQQVEYDSLMLMNGIDEGCVPTPYCLDTKHHIFAMKDLTDWSILGDKLHKEQEVNLEVAADLGRVLGKIHRQTTRSNLTPEEWQDLVEKFRHEDSVERMTNSFHKKHQNHEWATKCFKEEFIPRYDEIMDEMRDGGHDEKIVDIYKTEMCYVHPDVNAGNILTDGQRIAILDPEWGILSHPAMNIGFVLSRCYVKLYLNAVAATKHKEPTGSTEAETAAQINQTAQHIKDQAINAIKIMMQSYIEVRCDLPNNDLSLESLLSTTILLLATHIMNLPVRDTSLDYKLYFEEGYKFLVGYAKVKSFDDFMAIFQ